MIDDPGAWIADFDSPINFEDIFCSYFPLFLMLLGLCTIVDWTTPGFTLLIVKWFFQLNTFLIAYLAPQWSLLVAPATWFLALLALGLRAWIFTPSKSSVDDAPPFESRRDQRHQDRSFQGQSRKASSAST
jgi:hypothetical protein